MNYVVGSAIPLYRGNSKIISGNCTPTIIQSHGRQSEAIEFDTHAWVPSRVTTAINDCYFAECLIRRRYSLPALRARKLRDRLEDQLVRPRISKLDFEP